MKKFNVKKLVSVVLTLIMVLTLINVSTFTVLAEFDYERFFDEATSLIADNWEDGFVESIVFTVNDPYMFVDGIQIEIDPGAGTSPVIVDGRTLLPIRSLVEEVGGEISFDAAQQRVIIEDDQLIELQIGSYQMFVDGELYNIDVAPTIINNRTMLPIRAVTENLGFEIEWEDSTQQITLTRDFQTRRLIVRTVAEPNFPNLGATNVIRGPDNITVLQFSTIHETQIAYDRLLGMANVIWVEPDFYIILEQYTTSYVGFEQTSANHRSWGVASIGADRFANHLLQNGRTQQINVAVLDSGIDPRHPFLQGRISGWANFITTSQNPYDENGHGTHVAGTVVDSTPGLNVQIVPVKVLRHNRLTGRSEGSTLGISNGIRWAASRSDVINMSLGGRHNSQLNIDAVQYAISRNTTVVVAAGNNSENARYFSPAHITNAITVAATDSNDRRATFTNFGNSVDVAAPGVNIDSSIPNGGFRSKSGTSMAAPHVAAAAAMYILQNPGISPAQVQAAMRRYVRVPTGWNASRYGTGILDMTRAIPAGQPQPPQPPTGTRPTITTTSLPSGAMGVAYHQTLVATGATPITWSVIAGLLPGGLTLNPNTGVISGTPGGDWMGLGGTFEFTVRAQNSAGYATRDLMIAIEFPPTISGSALAQGTIGVAYNARLSATSATPVTWSITSGSLPNGLNLNTSTGEITGTPTVAGDFDFTVRAQNPAGSATRQARITINSQLHIVTTELWNGSVGTLYDGQRLWASTTEASTTWSITSGRLPNGLSLNASTGAITGTPTVAGTFNFTVRVQNRTESATRQLSITINAPPSITTTSLPSGTIGTAYRQTLVATGTTPITWRIEVRGGDLPNGLTLDRNTGVISGTPTVAGTFTFTVRAENAAGFARSDTRQLSITIASNQNQPSPPTTPPPSSGTYNGFVYESDGISVRITGFTGWSQNTVINIPANINGVPVRTIGNRAFWRNPVDVTRGRTINIPYTVREIGTDALMFSRIIAINVDSRNENFSSENGVLFNRDKTQLITYPAGKTTVSYHIPDSVTVLGRNAFSYNAYLQSVTMNNVTTFGEWQFAYCTNLRTVTLSSNLNLIANNSFRGNTNLTSLTIPGANTRFGTIHVLGGHSPQLTIHGVTGSHAENFARNRGINFTAIN